MTDNQKNVRVRADRVAGMVHDRTVAHWSVAWTDIHWTSDRAVAGAAAAVRCSTLGVGHDRRVSALAVVGGGADNLTDPGRRGSGQMECRSDRGRNCASAG